MYTKSSRTQAGIRIDREFSNPDIVLALQHMDEDILAEILDDTEVLEALMHARESGEPTRPANEFFAELQKELA
uniref:Uncharacterized protein n=2 Tax=Candidatus Kentrum sp. LFY TaxID=2126342 RepID=A0A450UTX6_9GAMM|nr:MAG: hypothetical protein BECKLFY1418A_GA0070994_10547 [Candidatus Kentron sp. LFY]